ncbi:MAG TPA: hypothetical protein VII95_18510 [Terriglobales bacterium]|jgi:tetratricopeptide (TPR) repeat protein
MDPTAIAFTQKIGLAAAKKVGELLYQWATDTKVQPVEEAIKTTSEQYPMLNDLDTTLRQWLRNPQISETVRQYVEGLTTIGEVPIQLLAKAMVDQAGFYLGESSLAPASDVIASFLLILRDEFLTLPTVSGLHVANRLEADHQEMMAEVRKVQTMVAGISCALPSGDISASLKKKFDHGLSALDSGKPADAKALFDALAEEIAQTPGDHRQLLAKTLTNYAKALMQIGEVATACDALVRAHEAEALPATRLNLAIVSLINNNPQEALRLLEELGPEMDSAVEFWQAKISAMIGVGREAEAVVVARKLPEALSPADRKELLGVALLLTGDYVEAEPLLADAVKLKPDSPEYWVKRAECIYVPILQSRNESPVPPSLAESTEKARLRAALAALKEARRLATEGGRSSLASDIQLNVGILKMALGEFQDALAEFKPIIESIDPDPAVWRNAGICLLLTGKANEAVEALSKSPQTERHLGTETVMFNALLASGRAKDAIIFAKQRAETPVDKDNLKWHVRVAEALSADRQFTEAKLVLTQLKAGFGTSPELSLSLAQYYDATGDVELANDAYSHAVSAGDSTIASRARFLYGLSLYAQQKFARAVDMLRPIVPTDEPTPVLVLFAFALYGSGEYGQVTAILTKLLSDRKPLSEPLAEVGAACAEYLCDLDLAIQLYEYLADNYGNQVKHVTRLAISKYRRGEREAAGELLVGIRKKISTAADLLAAAEAYLAISKYITAVELAHAALLAAPDDPNVHVMFIWYSLVAGKHARAELSEKYVSVHNEVLERFNERFPDGNLLERVKFGDTDEAIQQVLARISDSHKRTTEILRLYETRRIALSLVAKLAGKSEFETWLGMISDDRLRVYMAYGSPEEELGCGVALDKAAGGKLILGSTALFTFAMLGLLSKLADNFTCVVPQSTLDELHRVVSHQAANVDGYLHVWKEGEQFFRFEVTPEIVAKQNKFLHDLVKFVEKRCQCAGLQNPPTSDDLDLADKIGNHNVHTALLAKQLDMPVLLDDKPLAELCRLLHQTVCVNSQAVLLYLKQKCAITESQQLSALQQLLACGYTYVRLHQEQMYLTLEREHFNLSPKVRTVLQTLELAETTFESAARVAAWLLRSLFLDALPEATRRNVGMFVLEAVTRHHARKLMLVRVRTLLSAQMGFLVPVQLQRANQLITEWELTQRVVF